MPFVPNVHQPAGSDPAASSTNAGCYLEKPGPLDWSRCWPEAQSEAGQLLRNAGLSPAMLWEQWGIVLWSLRLKDKRVKLKVDAAQPVDEAALHAWLVSKLGARVEVSIKFKPIAACCGSGCQGCLIGNPSG